MNIKNTSYDNTNIIIPLFEKQKANLNFGKIINHHLDSILKQNLFSAKKKQVFSSFVEINKKLQLIIFIGLGKKTNSNDLRQLAGEVISILKKLKIKSINFDATQDITTSAFIEGLILGQYTFRKCHTEKKIYQLKEINIITKKNKVLKDCLNSQIICDATNWARLLADLPGNLMTPKILATQTQNMAKKIKLDCQILNEKDMKKLKMNALLAVSSGSEEEAQLIILKHTHPKATKTISIVGKGLTFDAGGISLKPSKGMQEMKYDMCGGSAVIGAMKAIKQLNLPINIIGAIPSSENLISGKAIKPGDVVTAYNGKTISIHNTDAEGRLILADTLAYICEKYKPDMIVDTATLTGACITCLGHHLGAIISENQVLANSLIKSGNKVYERLWQLPLNEDYKELMEGADADLCNIGPPEAGTITAAAFLSNFVNGCPWAHIDIAGVAWSMKGASYINPKTASGFGTRLFVQWIKDLCQ